MSLFSALGHRYCSEWLVGSVYCTPEVRGTIRNFSDYLETATVTSFEGQWPNIRRNSVTVNIQNERDTWDVLSYPKLGYRILDNGKYAAYLSKAKSTRRGLSLHNLQVNMLPYVQGMSEVQENHGAGSTLDYMHYDDYYRIAAALMPEFIPYSQGMADISAGRRIAFAINEDCAVVPSSTRQEMLDILYREKIIAHVTPDGVITTNGSVSAASLSRLIPSL